MWMERRPKLWFWFDYYILLSLYTSFGSESFSFSLFVSVIFEKQQQHKHSSLYIKINITNY